jgi:alkylated DNA repair dioxygenase AlkB
MTGKPQGLVNTGTEARSNHYELLPLRDANIRYYPCFFDEETAERYLRTLLREVAWEQRTLFIFGKRHLEPRLTAWYGDEGAQYSYSGTTRHPKPWTPLLLEIKKRVEQAAGVRYNSLLLNQYRDGKDSVSWHSDAEESLGHNPSIASVSFGAVRSFHLRHRQNAIKSILGMAACSSCKDPRNTTGTTKCQRQAERLGRESI